MQQVAMAQLNFAPEQAERTISECLCHQYQDGHAVLGFGRRLTQISTLTRICG